MIQLTQNLKTGKMELTEVPCPRLTPKNILVRNHYSLISAGTEGGKVVTARKGYLGKAKEKPQQVKQVLDTLKKEGITNTYRKVMNSLDALSPLGYSCSGVIEAVGEEVTGFQVGDKVACAGGDIANHAEFVSIPCNLAVKVPENVSLLDASYTTVAAIALQGIRQADLRLGESCLVIGLGLLGQLTIQMLKVAGIKAFGVDIDKNMVNYAFKSGADLAFTRENGEIEQSIKDNSGGYGVDAVIITAGTSSTDPVELAGRVCRSKGKVVIVGAVPTGFSRGNYYQKELELRMSTSYGPGRYDPNYENKGLDYPIGYVRWTENRNMQAYLDLLSQNKLNLKLLTTHIYNFEDAPNAYQLIVDNSEVFVGLALKYDINKIIKKEIEINKKDLDKQDLAISFLGAGSFAQNSLLPNLINSQMISVVTGQGHTSKNVAQKYGFGKSSCQPESIFLEKESNIVFIATRHDSHGEYVQKCLEAQKHVFVEKPLCLKEEELESISEIYKKSNAHLMVGYNRRFAPYIQTIKNSFTSSTKKSFMYRINAGSIPKEHWIQDIEVGGGRILGEVCHFIDLLMFLADSLPKSISAMVLDDSSNLDDTLVINIKFKNGSIGHVSYFSNGSKSLNKEYLEVYSNGQTAVLDDFRKLTIYGNNEKKYKSYNQDKGHKEEVKQFLEAIKDGKPCPISFSEIYWSSKMSFDILKSIKTGNTIRYE